MNSSHVQKSRTLCSRCRKVSVRFTILLFLGLIMFVFVNLLSSTSKLSVIVDMSIKMRSNVVEVLHNLSNMSSFDTENETVSLTSIPAQNYNRTRKDGSAYFEFSDERMRKFFKNQSGDGEINNETAVNKHLVSNSDSEHSSGSRLADKDIYKLGTSPDGAVIFNETKENYEFQSDIINITKMKIEIDKYGNKIDTNVNIRQSTCNTCFEHKFNYVIQNEDICKLYTDESIDLLILIFTTHKNNQARAVIRETWLSITKNNTANIRYVFLLGETKETKYKESVLDESKKSRDIIKEDFIDSYGNLTYKTIMGFKWAATKCAHAHYVMKTDDDMFVNIPNLLNILTGPVKEELQSSVIGACFSKARPNRDKRSKWFASVKSYPEKYYPGFCSGTGYVTSMTVATEVYKISPSVPFFHLEDVYVSLCIKKLGFKLKGMPGFNTGRPKLDPCIYKSKKLVTAHQLNPLMLRLIWRRNCLKMPV